MYENVQGALFNIMGQCFPNWRDEVRGDLEFNIYDEYSAWYIRSLVPVESDICTGSNTPVDPQNWSTSRPSTLPRWHHWPSLYDRISWHGVVNLAFLRRDTHWNVRLGMRPQLFTRGVRKSLWDHQRSYSGCHRQSTLSKWRGVSDNIY